jgi:hypothetical protein
LEELIDLFKSRLVANLREFAEYHLNKLSDENTPTVKFLRLMKKEAKKLEKRKDVTPVVIVAYAMWTMQTLNQLGVFFGMGPAQLNWYGVTNQDIDEARAKRLALICSSCLALQALR